MIISCVKWGDKYTYEHVNRLYAMCKRNYTGEFRFICHTEDSTEIIPDIEINPLNTDLDLEKWWWKLTLFDEDAWPLSKRDVHMFFDLDVVIQNNINHFENYAVDGKMTMIKAFWKTYPITGTDMDHNSSIMIWKGDCSYLWRKLTKNMDVHLLKYNGIDGFVYHECRDHITTLPEGEVYSRLFGVNKDKCFTYGEFKDYFYEPDYPVCIFNGWRRDMRDGEYLLDDEGYKGFEHYWEKTWWRDNHTGIDRHLWQALWECASEGKDIVHFLDSLSGNQWESKKWLLDKVTDYLEDEIVENISKVQLFGGWFAHPMCTLLTSAFDDLEWIENTDIDEHALHVCRNINQELPCELITTEGNVMNLGDRDWDTDLVINTSSEHMPPLPVILANRNFRKHKDNSAQGPTIFAIQSNNMFHVPDHINCVKDEDELVNLSELTNVLYKGSLAMPNGYKRFMVIGYV